MVKSLSSRVDCGSDLDEAQQKVNDERDRINSLPGGKVISIVYTPVGTGFTFSIFYETE